MSLLFKYFLSSHIVYSALLRLCVSALHVCWMNDWCTYEIVCSLDLLFAWSDLLVLQTP